MPGRLIAFLNALATNETILDVAKRLEIEDAEAIGFAVLYWAGQRVNPDPNFGKFVALLERYDLYQPDSLLRGGVWGGVYGSGETRGTNALCKVDLDPDLAELINELNAIFTAEEFSNSDLVKAKRIWLMSLQAVGCRRGISETEEHQIQRALKDHGYGFTALALYGARLEPVRRDFDPRDYFKIGRVLRGDRIDGYVNLASRELGRKAQARLKTQAESQTENRAESQAAVSMPADARRKLEALGLLPKSGAGSVKTEGSP